MDDVRHVVRRPLAALLPWAGLVALCGALGTIVRAVLETAHPAAEHGFPWTTWTINMVGSFLLGVLQEALALSGPDSGWRKAVRIGAGTGVIGGFTTYSTFVLESDRLLTGSGAQFGLGVVYVVGSVLVGLFCAALGMEAGRAGVRSLSPHTATPVSGGSEPATPGRPASAEGATR
ncbi:MAG: CrcB family protein [Actinomyces sp.]|nr:CrcB family protein [Actinomyces sp.]MDN6565553.1 CrcB family protein [Actinomyces sp.]MDN6795100.1 CrcB family protein [Propionibacterium sp.]